jgi:Holin of 3TMs, for gene-transfer release
LGTLGLFVAAMVNPLWFSARMQGIALVPEPLWWLLGVIVSFYFGARHQQKHQSFQRDIAVTMARTPQVADNIRRLTRMSEDMAKGPDTALAATVGAVDPNPALEDWKALRGAAR